MSEIRPPQCLCCTCDCVKRTANKGRLCGACIEQNHVVDHVRHDVASPYARRHHAKEPVVKVHGKRQPHRGRHNGQVIT